MPDPPTVRVTIAGDANVSRGGRNTNVIVTAQRLLGLVPTRNDLSEVAM